MGKQRTRRRRPHTPQQRAVEQAQQQRRKQRREARAQERASGTKRRRTGWAGLRRTRAQRTGITVVAVAGTVLIWLFADWPLAIGLTVLLLVGLPAFVVLTMGRRY